MNQRISLFLEGKSRTNVFENMQKAEQESREQLIDLVKQAHKGISFQTKWNVSVGADMRQKLCYPFTPQQVEQMRLCQSKPEIEKFQYQLIKWKWTDDIWFGIIAMDIQYKNTACGLDFHFSNVKLKICCNGKSGHGWKVSSVEPIR